MLQQRHATMPSDCTCGQPSGYCELLAIKMGLSDLTQNGSRGESNPGDGVDDFQSWLGSAPEDLP
jgi:hypothetical protein